MFINYIYQKNKHKKFVDVNALISGYKKSRKGTKTCIYEYEFNGQKYKVADNFYTNIKVPQLGTIKQIRINPNDPSEVVSRVSGGVLPILAILFMVMGGILLIVIFGIIG